MLELPRTLRRNKEGATAIEYGLIIALISAVAIVAMTAVGTSWSEIYNIINNAMGVGS